MSLQKAAMSKVLRHKGPDFAHDTLKWNALSGPVIWPKLYLRKDTERKEQLGLAQLGKKCQSLVNM